MGRPFDAPFGRCPLLTFFPLFCHCGGLWRKIFRSVYLIDFNDLFKHNGAIIALFSRASVSLIFRFRLAGVAAAFELGAAPRRKASHKGVNGNMAPVSSRDILSPRSMILFSKLSDMIIFPACLPLERQAVTVGRSVLRLILPLAPGSDASPSNPTPAKGLCTVCITGSYYTKLLENKTEQIGQMSRRPGEGQIIGSHHRPDCYNYTLGIFYVAYYPMEEYKPENPGAKRQLQRKICLFISRCGLMVLNTLV